MIISIYAADTSFEDYNVFITLSRTNISLLSHAKFRDHDLINDLRRFAVFHDLSLNIIYLTSNLLYLLLNY